MCSVVSQKSLARKSLSCWLLPRNSPSERWMHCTRRGQKIISCLLQSTFGSLAGPVLIWPCMERRKPTPHLVSQLIHPLVSQLQRAAPLVNTQSALLARSQSHPKTLPLFGGCWWLLSAETPLISAKTLHEMCRICLFLHAAVWKSTLKCYSWEGRRIKNSSWVLALVSILVPE